MENPSPEELLAYFYSRVNQVYPRAYFAPHNRKRDLAKMKLWLEGCQPATVLGAIDFVLHDFLSLGSALHDWGVIDTDVCGSLRLPKWPSLPWILNKIEPIMTIYFEACAERGSKFEFTLPEPALDPRDPPELQKLIQECESAWIKAASKSPGGPFPTTFVRRFYRKERTALAKLVEALDAQWGADMASTLPDALRIVGENWEKFAHWLGKSWGPQAQIPPAPNTSFMIRHAEVGLNFAFQHKGENP